MDKGNVDAIAGCPGYGADNASFFIEKIVDKRGFADVGSPDDR